MDLETDFSSDSDYDEFANETPFVERYPAVPSVWTRFHNCWNTKF